MTLIQIYNLMTHEERVKVANYFYPPKIHQILKREKIKTDLLHKMCVQKYKK